MRDTTYSYFCILVGIKENYIEIDFGPDFTAGFVNGL